ncbi:MAG: sugar transferase [Clostridia bacterium]|nr:sugar transferase [Clostridia bacterium]
MKNLMIKKEDLKRFLLFISSSMLILFIVAAFYFIWSENYTENPFYQRGDYLIAAVYGIIAIIFIKMYDGFEIGYLKMPDIIFSQSLGILGADILLYLITCLVLKDIAPILPIVKLIIVDVAIIVAWTLVCDYLYIKVFKPKKLLIVYAYHNATDLITKMIERPDQYDICEAVNINEGSKTIREKIQKYEGVIICDIHGSQRNDLLKYCYSQNKRVYITPKISDILVRHMQPIHLIDTPLFIYRNQDLTLEERVLKRVFDIVFSLIAIILTFPLMICVAIAIKVHDKVPVFYFQDRVTKNGKIFKIYKFRSMIVDAERFEDKKAEENDERITPVGRIIRRLRIDEFPQFFNILKGDMSFVGPRPERVSNTKEYEKTLPEFELRLRVKAGLTGYAQVHSNYNTSAYDKLRLDIFYITNYSFLTDFKILLLTIKVLFNKKSTEGFIPIEETDAKIEADGDLFTLDDEK